MKLTPEVLGSFTVAKVIRDHHDRINSMSFSPSGDTLISTSDDDSMVVYDCQEGCPKRTLNSKKYGCDLIQFTHAANAVIHSSNKVDDQIRYLSLHDNKYLRYYAGHTKRVVALQMSPIDDTFISGALDKTIRLWDLRSTTCHGLMHMTGRPVAAFDPEGLIFAAGIDSSVVKLYDLRTFDKGPFSTFRDKRKQAANTGDFQVLKFSPDGKLIVITTSLGHVFLLDAFNGQELHSLKVPVSSGPGRPAGNLDVSFTPDSQFILVGGGDGRIHIFQCATGMRLCSLEGPHGTPCRTLAFNPKFMMLASACKVMAFWIPAIEQLQMA